MRMEDMTTSYIAWRLNDISREKEMIFIKYALEKLEKEEHELKQELDRRKC